MAGRARDIRRLAFRHNAKPGLGFEIFRLSALYARADRQLLGHALDVPQRLEFHLVYVGLRGAGSLIVDFRPVPLGARTLTATLAVAAPDGRPLDVTEAALLLARPEAGIETLRRPLAASGGGRYVAPHLVLPLAGRWTGWVELWIDDYTLDRLPLTLDLP